jgi:anti-sigma factor RsiW
MAACPDYDELLTLHAAGALETDDAARVRAHLEACAGCRAEAASTAAVLGGLALPAPTAREEAVVEALPRRTLSAWRREQVRKAARMQWVGALLAAAAVVMLVLVPSVRSRGPVRAVAPTPASAPATTETPDETLEAFDAWALGDPLGEVLGGDDEADASAEAFESEEGLSDEETWDSYLGETL